MNLPIVHRHYAAEFERVAWLTDEAGDALARPAAVDFARVAWAAHCHERAGQLLREVMAHTIEEMKCP